MLENNVLTLASLIGGMRSVDLAPKLERGMPIFPTHPHLVIDPTVVHRRDGYYCQSISMAEHTGCHATLRRISTPIECTRPSRHSQSTN